MCVLNISNAASLLIKCEKEQTSKNTLPSVRLVFYCNGYMRFGALDNLTKALNKQNSTVRCRGCLARQSQSLSEDVMCSKYDTNDPGSVIKDCALNAAS